MTSSSSSATPSVKEEGEEDGGGVGPLERSEENSAASNTTNTWAWADACPEFVTRHGWRARAYGKDGVIQAGWYNVSIFDVPADFWTSPEGLLRGRASVDDDDDGEGVLERCDSSGGKQAGGVLEGEEEGGGGGVVVGLHRVAAKTTVCSRCRCEVQPSERLAHYQSAWHLHNLRRALARKAPLDKEAFQGLLEVKEEEGQGEEEERRRVSAIASSLSSVALGSGGGEASGGDDEGSEEEEEEEEEVMEVQSESAEISVNVSAFYSVTVWSPLLSAEARRETNQALIRAMQALGRPQSPVRPLAMWAVLIMRSGRFAGAVFEGTKVVVHKAFKRYTTRKKAGGSQSSYDKKGRRAQSAGAALRRYGEVMTKEDIARILEAWTKQVGACSLVFLSVPKSLRGNLVGPDKPLFHKDDPRLRSVPFMTNDPSFAEVQAVHAKLSTIRFSPPHAPPPPPSSTKQAAPPPPPGVGTEEGGGISRDLSSTSSDGGGWKKGGPSFQDAGAVFRGESEDSVVMPQNSRLYEAIVSGGTVEEVRQLLATTTTTTGEGGGGEEGVNYCGNEGGATALHAAAARGSEELVEMLLNEGADPCALDDRGRVPYFLCPTKAVRDAFRRQRAKEPDRWDWHRGGVPEALTEEAERKKREKQRDKKKKAKVKKKEMEAKAQQEKAEGGGGGAAAAIPADENEGAGDEDDDEEEDDSRMKCDHCKKPVRTLFTRLQFVYCSTACVMAHKRSLLAEAALKRLG